jgi:hypothetical protein
MQQADAPTGTRYQTTEAPYADTDVDQRQPDPVTTSGATFATFDPTKETVTFGKWSGSKWSEVPLDYIQWLAKGANKPDIKAKAEGTLAYLERLNEQKPPQVDPFVGTFDQAPEPAGEVDPMVEHSAKITQLLLLDIKDAKKSTGLNEIIKDAKKHLDAGDLTDKDTTTIRDAIAAKTAELSKSNEKKGATK